MNAERLSERDMLLAAVGKLEASLPANWSSASGWFATFTNMPSNFGHVSASLVPLLVRQLRETAAEYENPNTVVVCQHCWDNINIARVILGLEQNDPGEEE